MTKWDLSQEYKVGLTLQNQLMYYTMLIKENHMIISINAKKHFTILLMVKHY